MGGGDNGEPGDSGGAGGRLGGAVPGAGDGVCAAGEKNHWKEFLLRLKKRGLRGVRRMVSDDPPGLKPAAGEVLPEAWWQRCYVRALWNALEPLSRKADDDCLQELQWM